MKSIKTYCSDFLSLVENLLIVPRCVVCDTLLPHHVWMCPECAKQWQKERLRPCPICKKECRECNCLPLYLIPNVRLTLSHPFFCAYYEAPPAFTGHLVYRLKRQYNKRLLRFAALEMAARITPYLQDHPAETVICYVPRTKNEIHKYGFDQAQKLSKMISDLLHLPQVKAFEKTSALIQKELDFKNRIIHARNAYRILPSAKEKIAGKRIVLVDDVITSGASMCSCAEHLQQAGAVQILPLSLLRAIHSHQKGEFPHDNS